MVFATTNDYNTCRYKSDINTQWEYKKEEMNTKVLEFGELQQVDLLLVYTYHTKFRIT